MKFQITSTERRNLNLCRDDEERDDIEFDTLEEFFEWVSQQDHMVIIGNVEDDVQILELYDDYRE